MSVYPWYCTRSVNVCSLNLFHRIFGIAIQHFISLSLHRKLIEQKYHRTAVSHFVSKSFRTHFLVISYRVITILYQGHFVPILVISYLGQLGTKWLYGGQFVPKSFRTLFDHFVPILVVSYYPTKMDGWMDVPQCSCVLHSNDSLCEIFLNMFIFICICLYTLCMYILMYILMQILYVLMYIAVYCNTLLLFSK